MVELGDSFSCLVACLLIVMTVMAHLAGRSGHHGRLIRVLFAVMTFSTILLYFSGTFALAEEVIGLIQKNETSLRSAAGVSKFCKDLRSLAANQVPQVMLFITTVYLFLQTLCIPGTIVLNAATGAVIGTLVGVPFCTLLGTLGASCCYALSGLIGVSLVENFDARLMKGKGLTKIRTQVNRYRSDLLVYILFLRLTPILPNWLVNLASPVVGVPLRVFAIATFLGIIPQTYLTVRFGAIAHSSTDGNKGIVSIWDTLLLAVLGATLLGVYFLKKRFSASSSTSHPSGVYSV